MTDSHISLHLPISHHQKEGEKIMLFFFLQELKIKYDIEKTCSKGKTKYLPKPQYIYFTDKSNK